VYDSDKQELVKQYQDKYRGESVSGVGVNSQGDLVNMSIKYTTVMGE
jgi:hypothetical protein